MFGIDFIVGLIVINSSHGQDRKAIWIPPGDDRPFCMAFGGASCLCILTLKWHDGENYQFTSGVCPRPVCSLGTVEPSHTIMQWSWSVSELSGIWMQYTLYMHHWVNNVHMLMYMLFMEEHKSQWWVNILSLRWTKPTLVVCSIISRELEQMSISSMYCVEEWPPL